MDKPFKFRYANEIAGTFVLIALMVMVAGVFLAGQAQGWFERKFVVHLVFDTDEGSFGLQEGNEVQIRNTVAGRVGKIRPTAGGSMKTSLLLQEQFHPFVTRDSVAKVRRKFGIAGDAFVVIEKGSGPPVVEDDILLCIKDEEITDQAQRVLKDVQDVVLPMMEQIQEILKHVNGILETVDDGKGMAGKLVHDEDLASEVKSSVYQLNGLLRESDKTLRETRRLIEGVQEHWLFRKYIRQDEYLLPVPVPLRPDACNAMDIPTLELDIQKARAANHGDDIAKNAYLLAACKMASGDYKGTRAFLAEAEMAASDRQDDMQGLLQVMRAELSRREGNAGEAFRKISSIIAQSKRSQAYLRINASLVGIVSLCDMQKHEEAEKMLLGLESLIKKHATLTQKASVHYARGQIFLQKELPKSAAEQFDREADYYQAVGAYMGMADALREAGDSYYIANKLDLAVDRYFKAGRSLSAAGNSEQAELVFAKVRILAKQLDKRDILLQLPPIQMGTQNIH